MRRRSALEGRSYRNVRGYSGYDHRTNLDEDDPYR
jgi:hypothetical protein